MDTKKRKAGRPKLPARPNVKTLYVREVDKNAIRILHLYAVNNDMTIREAFADIMRNTAEQLENKISLISA